MKRQLNHIWRLLGTGLSFSLFGVGGILLGLLVFPVLFLVIRDAHKRRVVARTWIGKSFCLFVSFMNRMGVLSYRIEGLERLEGSDSTANCLVVANHPTLIDVVFLICLFPQADCVIKSALWRNPFTRFVVSAADYIPNDNDFSLLDTCTEKLKKGGMLILFPEGTRSIPGQRIQFKPGAAAIAVRAESRLLPVLIKCRPTTLTKGQPWYHIPKTKPFFELRILEPMELEDLVEPGLAKRKTEKALNHVLEEFLRHRAEV